MLYFVFHFDMDSQHVTAGLVPMVFLPQPLLCWAHRYCHHNRDAEVTGIPHHDIKDAGDTDILYHDRDAEVRGILYHDRDAVITGITYHDRDAGITGIPHHDRDAGITGIPLHNRFKVAF